MDINIEKLAENALGIVKAVAPLVGMSEEVEAAEALIEQVSGLVDTIKDVVSNDSQAELVAGMEALRADAKAKVKRATDRL